MRDSPPYLWIRSTVLRLLWGNAVGGVRRDVVDFDSFSSTFKFTPPRRTIYFAECSQSPPTQMGPNRPRAPALVALVDGCMV